MHAKLQFFCFRPEIPFLSKYGPKIKIVSLGWNLEPRLIRICTIQWWCSLSLFSTRIQFVGKFGPKIQNCKFKLKPGTQTNSNKQNSKVVSTFPVLDQKYPFWANLVQKIKIVSFSWNLVPRLIWICKFNGGTVYFC